MIIVTRVLFIALYKDWHGGFCLGPRYLFMVVPFMMIPAVLWIKEIIEKRIWKSWIAASIVLYGCVVQQLYFVIGEIFSYYHLLRFQNLSKGIDVFTNDRIYMSWNLSPLVHLHQHKRGPWLLQSFEISNMALWIWGCVAVLIVFIIIIVMIKKSEKSAYNK
jgi:hypothetical protein